MTTSKINLFSFCKTKNDQKQHFKKIEYHRLKYVGYTKLNIFQSKVFRRCYEVKKINLFGFYLLNKLSNSKVNIAISRVGNILFDVIDL
jgi:hypothetical protein